MSDFRVSVVKAQSNHRFVKINCKLSMPGLPKEVEFDFDLQSDTIEGVAREMVRELEFPIAEIRPIQKKIEEVLSRFREENKKRAPEKGVTGTGKASAIAPSGLEGGKHALQESAQSSLKQLPRAPHGKQLEKDVAMGSKAPERGGSTMHIGSIQEARVEPS